MLQPLDGPALQTTLSINTVTVQELKVGGSRLVDRKAVTIQTDNKLYIYFGDADSAAPSAATVAANGFLVFKDAKESFEAGDKQPIYALSVAGTTNAVIAERA